MSDISISNKKYILDELDDEGKLPCLKAFKVAKKMNVEVIKMAKICESINIKITSCELGVFGNIDFKDFEDKIYDDIRKNSNNEYKLKCKTLWNEARKTSLRRVGSTVKKSNIDVIYCQLGCFKEKLSHANKS